MSTAPKPKATLAAKAVQMVYDFPGDLKKGWEAERTGDSTYLIHRGNGTTREVNLYEPIRTAKGDLMPMRNEHGLLVVGEWSVLIGRNINHEMHARKLGKPNTYLVFDQSMKQLGKFEIGQSVDGSPVSLVDGHLLKVGEDIVPIKPKKFDITLLVMQEEVENGNMSFINVIELGNTSNRKDGAPGVFIRPNEVGEPAQFIENFSGRKVVTAQFWIDKKDRRVDYHFREASTAYEANMLSAKLEECRTVAINAGLDPDEYYEYAEVKKKMEEIDRAWRKDSMALSTGAEMFKPKAFSKHLDSSRHP